MLFRDLAYANNYEWVFCWIGDTSATFKNVDPDTKEKVIKELLRIGKQAIVTIPNFGYWKIRLHLLLKGTMPVTKTLPDEWYNTPNIHLCTIKDFVFFSKNKNFKLSKSIALKDNKLSIINETNLNIKNLSSNLGIFLIER